MIIGQKVCLGPLLHGDAPLMFNWLNTLTLAHQNGTYRPNDQMAFDRWFAALGDDRSKVMFGIRAREDLRLLGYIQITNIHAVCRTAELGILMGSPDDRNKGFGQEALRLALAFCWNDLNLNRLTLYVHGHNPAAIHAYEKVGFVTEGRMRQGGYVDGNFVDITVMGLLRHEWGRGAAPDDPELR